MADEKPADGTPPSDARTPESIQAEFYRKTEKLTADNQALSQKLDQMANLIQQQANRQTSAPAPQSVDMSDEQLEELSYKDPKGYARVVRDQATRDAARMVDARMNTQNQTNMIMGQLVSEYPELGDQSSELSVRAVQLYNQLPANEKADPRSYKIAVRDAAAELGVQVKSKRIKSDDDAFTLAGNAGKSPRQPKKDDGIDARTLEFAKLIGVDINDPKKLARLKERSNRKNWGKFE